MSPQPQLERDFLGTVVKRRSVAGLRLTETVLQGRSRTPRHFHENSLLGWALEGAYSNAYDSGAQEVHDSKVMFCPAGEPHATLVESGAVTFALEFDESWMKRLSDLPGLDHPAVFDLASLASLKGRLYTEFNEVDRPSSIAIEGLTLEIMAVAMRLPASPVVREPYWLAAAREILIESYRNQFTIRELADKVQMHPVYLATTFRQKYGCSILDFLRQLRVDYACGQLRKSDEPLAAIAQDSGFSDQSHFSRVFKRLTGTTPAAYRAGARAGRRINL